MGASAPELIYDSDLQADGMKQIVDRVDSAAAVSLMDLSVEVECIGSNTVISDNEVPTVKGAVVTSFEEAESLEVPVVGICRTGIYIDGIRKAVEKITDRPVFA